MSDTDTLVSRLEAVSTALISDRPYAAQAASDAIERIKSDAQAILDLQRDVAEESQYREYERQAKVSAIEAARLIDEMRAHIATRLEAAEAQVAKMQEDRDSWRRVAERLEGEVREVISSVASLPSPAEKIS